MNMKCFAILALVLCLALSLCACGNAAGNTETTAETTADTTAATQEATETVDDGKVTYTVKVVDEGGNPVAGAMVQLCKETCLPGLTNAEGVAQFDVVEDEYKVSFMVMPEGYQADAEAFYFDDGSYEMTITLKAAA